MYKKVSKFQMIASVVLLLLSVGLAIFIGICSLQVKDGMSGVFLVDEGEFVRSETVYVLFVFLVALIVFLLFTIISFLIENRSIKTKAKPELPTGRRFAALLQTDELYKSQPAPTYEEMESLERLCNEFHEYAASNLRLYYDMNDIRGFIAGLGVSKLHIMQGISGTGKTSLATAFGEYLLTGATVVSVQPMWKERSDLMGYYNEFTKKFTESTLLKTLYEAHYTDDIRVIVLDEMNIARVEYYFADFLSQLELSPDNRYIEIVSSQWGDDPVKLDAGRIGIPENVWFVGTANNDDSTFSISDKVYDRSMLTVLNSRSAEFSAEQTEGKHISYSCLHRLFEEAKKGEGISQKNVQHLKTMDQFLIRSGGITYGNRMYKQLEEYVPLYVACGGREIDAIDDFFAKKILRKMESLSPLVLRRTSEGLYNLILELFREDEMLRTKAWLKTVGDIKA